MSGVNPSPIMSHDCTLENLGPELQRAIMLEVTSPSQLFNLIKSSPRLFHVFLLNKAFILSTIARRQFHPAVLSEALTLVNLLQSEQLRSRETAMQFCTDSSELRDSQTTFDPASEAVALCKLASNLKFFIEDYTRNTLPIMEWLGKAPNQVHGQYLTPEYWPEKPVLYSDLSMTEIGRLQRAFCRFEIYRKLFARCLPELDHDSQECARRAAVSFGEQASLYLGKFPDYQVAEINCIRDYLVRRLRGVCTQVEDEIAKTLSPETLVFDEDSDAETDQWDSGLFLFTEDGKARQRDHFEHLISLGLLYIRQIFESTGEERRTLFIRDNRSYLIQHLLARDFLTRALESLGRNPAWVDFRSSGETEWPCSLETIPATELDIPAAWSWAHTFGPPIELSDIYCKGLRDWGYVFWDHDRIRNSGILQQTSHDVQQSKFNEYEASKGPSVQQRLLKPLSIWYLGMKVRESSPEPSEETIDGSPLIIPESAPSLKSEPSACLEPKTSPNPQDHYSCKCM
jgi:hypothetical protein